MLGVCCRNVTLTVADTFANKSIKVGIFFDQEAFFYFRLSCKQFVYRAVKLFWQEPAQAIEVHWWSGLVVCNPPGRENRSERIKVLLQLYHFTRQLAFKNSLRHAKVMMHCCTG